MDETQRRVDEIRHRSSEMENHLIDTYRKGGIDRREFVRRGTVLGMSTGTIGFLASACGSGDEGGGGTTTSSDQQAQSVQKGGKVTAAINSPAGAIDPITVADDGEPRRARPRPASTSSGRTPSSTRCRAWPRAGRRTRTPPCGRSRSARASSSTTARR